MAWRIFPLHCATCFLLLVTRAAQSKPYVEYQPYDGFYNNLIRPAQGAVDGQLIRMSRSDYSDGVYEPSGQDRPNSLLISEVFHNGKSGKGSARNRTAFMVFFGQQVVEEIVDSQRPGCPPEFMFAKIPAEHERYANANLVGKSMPLLRTRYDQSTGYSPNNPRQQLNENTPYLDGGLFYGPAKAWTDLIRDFYRGRLKALDRSAPVNSSFPAKNDIRLPMANPPAPRQKEIFPVNRFYRLGNPRGNENPFLLTFGIIWFRWHNHVAETLYSTYGDTWDEETYFLETRKRVIAHYQKIVMYDWLPAWLSLDKNGTKFEIPSYPGYDRNVNPSIAQEFQSAAMRFGHTLVPNGVFRRRVKEDGTSEFLNTTMKTGFPYQHAVRLCNAYWNSEEAVNEDIDSLIMGMASQIAEAEDNVLVADLRGQLFGPLEFTRRDLAALNIERARDHGIADYNTVREHYGLSKKSFAQINPDEQIAKRLLDLYKNVDNIDLFTGGLLETTEEGPGELFRKITLDQFLRIRNGDRFWYENWKLNGLFTEEEMNEISQITMYDIITNVTNIQPDHIQRDLFVFKNGDPYPQPFQLNESHVEPCVEIGSFDYFSGSEISYALSFAALGLFLPATIGVLLLLARRRKEEIQAEGKAQLSRLADPEKITAAEWVGENTGERHVIVDFMRTRKKIHVTDLKKASLRLLDLRNVPKITLLEATDGEKTFLQIQIPRESDLILRFGAAHQRTEFVRRLEEFLRSLNINRDKMSTKESDILHSTNTKEERQKLLAKVTKIVCMQAFDRKPTQTGDFDSQTLSDVINVQITRSEFAEAMSLKPTSMFVRNMFNLLDKNNVGFLSFREFLDSFVIFTKGDADSKTRMIFDMYDVKHVNYLTLDQFNFMIRAMMELGDSNVDKDEIKGLTTSMLQNAGLSGKTQITYKDFQVVFRDYKDTIGQATFALSGIENEPASDGTGRDLRSRLRKTIIRNDRPTDGINNRNRRTTVRIGAKKSKQPTTKYEQFIYRVTSYIANYKLQIFWISLYLLLVAGIFIERAYYYSTNREHVGLRRIAGYGVTVTRGAASVIMFTYSSLLVTMCRNTITFLRETFLNKIIPFDSIVSFHKFIAIVALIFTGIHCVGHGINFYHICTQRSPDLNCLFREYFRPSHVLAKFDYWLFQTITGMTGVLLTVIVIIMYVFAVRYSRRYVFRWFWITHNLYVPLYILMVLHGSGRLVQAPIFQWFFLGPVILFTIDKIISLSMKTVEIPVIEAELLPSGVTHLVFKRPLNFDYLSGQWVRIASTELNSSEYHPFTLTSAPHENVLSLHIRAVGPWTNNIRRIYDVNCRTEKRLPKLYVDGPFGEGHQDWYKYDVSVLVGGGIGVTPFASILKDIVAKSRTGTRIHCKKVYFLWITRTQKHFEWMTDIIREVEESDPQNLVSVHIFITQFMHKFDLRTTMLYICEKHFQKVSSKSLFTGLKAITHFGRPDMYTFLESLYGEHPKVKLFGVFSCGPPPMTRSVESACTDLNKQQGPSYVHHFENF